MSERAKMRHRRNFFLVILGLVIFTLLILVLFNQTMPDDLLRRMSHAVHAVSDSSTHSQRQAQSTDINVTAVCGDLIGGSLTYHKVVEINNELKAQLPKDDEFSKLAHNCSEFRLSRGYDRIAPTELEQSFHLAFAVSVYKSTFQFEQLFRAIYRPWNFYCIHIDEASADKFRQSIRQIVQCFDNVFIPALSTTVVWASIYVLEAERLCQRELLKRSRSWKYYINLTGQEFPLKTNREIVEILREFRFTNDVMAYRLEDGSQPNKHRQMWRYYVSLKKGVTVSNYRKTETLPGRVMIYKGELHVALTRDFVKFLHNEPTAVAFYDWLNDTFCPDEHYYQSLHMLPFAPGSTELESRYTMSRSKIWETGRLNGQCRSRKFVRTICIFGSFDLPWLRAQPHLFANKFYGEDDPLLLRCLEEEIAKRTIRPVPLNRKFYRRFADTRTWDETAGVKWQLPNGSQ